MKDEKETYVPAEAEIVRIPMTDVITTSPTFDTQLPEGEWDEEM